MKEINRAFAGQAERRGNAGESVGWRGDILSPAWIDKTYGVHLGVRQCQRLFRQFEFRLRKPRPVLARADPARQKKHKKN